MSAIRALALAVGKSKRERRHNRRHFSQAATAVQLPRRSAGCSAAPWRQTNSNRAQDQRAETLPEPFLLALLLYLFTLINVLNQYTICSLVSMNITELLQKFYDMMQ